MSRAIIVCIIASLFFAYELMQLHALNAISAVFMKDLSLSAQEFSLISSSYLLADVLFLIPAGIILDRYSTRRVILGALFFCILGTFGFAFSTSVITASMSHFLSGIGNAFCFLSCMMLVSRWFPKEYRSLAVGVMITIGLSGGVIAQTPIAYVTTLFGWRETMLLNALLGLVIAGLIARFVYDAPTNESSIGSTHQGSFRSAISIQTILTGCYIGFMNLPIMMIGAVWGSLFLIQVHGLSLADASFITSFICIGTIIGSPLFGFLSDQIGRKRGFMLFGAIVSLLVFIVLLRLEYPSRLVLITTFFSLGFFTSTQVLGYPLITEQNPSHLIGRAQSVAAIIIMGLPLALQPLSGYLIDLGGSNEVIDGLIQYTMFDFLRGFIIFPLGFVLAIGSVFALRENQSKALQPISA